MSNPTERLKHPVSGAIARGEAVAVTALEVPELPHGCGSWIIEEVTTGKAVLELFNRKNVEKVLRAGPSRYRAHTALAWLQSLNDAPANTKPMGE